MRDPNRIPLVLKAVADFWATCPDVRLGQLLWILAKDDPFYMEDHELLQKIWTLNKDTTNGDLVKRSG